METDSRNSSQLKSNEPASSQQNNNLNPSRHIRLSLIIIAAVLVILILYSLTTLNNTPNPSDSGISTKSQNSKIDESAIQNQQDELLSPEFSNENIMLDLDAVSIVMEAVNVDLGMAEKNATQQNISKAANTMLEANQRLSNLSFKLQSRLEYSGSSLPIENLQSRIDIMIKNIQEISTSVNDNIKVSSNNGNTSVAGSLTLLRNTRDLLTQTESEAQDIYQALIIR